MRLFCDEMLARPGRWLRAAGGALRRCPECGRLYRPGGHVRRMLTELAAWNAVG